VKGCCGTEKLTRGGEVGARGTEKGCCRTKKLRSLWEGVKWVDFIGGNQVDRVYERGIVKGYYETNKLTPGDEVYKSEF
jgi:hypothetical protein